VAGTPNYGFVMMDFDETADVNKVAMFYSEEKTGSSFDPILIISYIAD
jgi:hypothetical protein